MLVCFLNKSGDANMSSFVVSLWVFVLRCVGAGSLSNVSCNASVVSMRMRPHLLLFGCPVFSCLMLKSPVMIVFWYLDAMFVMSVGSGFCLGQYIVAIWIGVLFCAVMRMAWCRFLLPFVMLTGGNSVMVMSDLCRMATPLSMLSVGTEILYVAVAVFIVLRLGFLDSFSVMMSG